MQKGIGRFFPFSATFWYKHLFLDDSIALSVAFCPSHFASPLLWQGDWCQMDWNGVWRRGCDEAEISEEKRLFTESWEGIQ